jgi:hypothetical protein
MKFMQAAHWTRFSAWLLSDINLAKERVDFAPRSHCRRDALTQLFGLLGHQ